MQNQEPTNLEILEAVNSFSTKMDSEVNDVKTEIGTIKTEIGTIKTEIGSIKTEIGGIKATMVTKDYLDDKLTDLRGDLVVLMRKEDTKLRTLVDVLKKRNLINEEDVKHILSMEPFAQISL